MAKILKHFQCYFSPKYKSLWVQILYETDCISHSTNTLGKGMNPIIFPPAMDK